MPPHKHGGDLVADTLDHHNVKWIFTLCGGHISPILTGCNKIGIRVIDVRHESTAVFAADAVSRLSNGIGVAVVTAGPGLTNTITAIKNAQMAQIPILILGGATATVLKGRGSLQDIDHIKLIRSIIKRSFTIKKVKDIQQTLHKSILMARSDVPGPVFVELPIDILYPEYLVRKWYGLKSNSRSMPGWLAWYLNWNVNRIFKKSHRSYYKKNKNKLVASTSIYFSRISEFLSNAQKPILLIGSQAMVNVEKIYLLVEALKKIGIPCYVSGMARGLLSNADLTIFRHARSKALKESDFILLAGVPCDFRLDYGRQINHKAKIISINRSKQDLYLNRKPTIGILGDSCQFLIDFSKIFNKKKNVNWEKNLLIMDKKRKDEILSMADKKSDFINPLQICLAINKHIKDGDIIVADGGDFVATASYILQPRSLTGWLDPGIFGTLGVGAGFIIGSQLTHPKSIIWAIFGDGAFGYSLIEFDTFVRHNIPVIAIIGNDSGWNQIARDQIDIFKDPISTELKPTQYHKAVEALGCVGLIIENETEIEPMLSKSIELAKSGKSVLINVKIGKTNFRKGSISM